MFPKDSAAFCKALTILASNHGTLPAKYEFRFTEVEGVCSGQVLPQHTTLAMILDLHNHAWFRGNSRKRIHPVGMKSPNHGNYMTCMEMREWVGNSSLILFDDSEQDEFHQSRRGYMKSASECKLLPFHKFRIIDQKLGRIVGIRSKCLNQVYFLPIFSCNFQKNQFCTFYDYFKYLH